MCAPRGRATASTAAFTSLYQKEPAPAQNDRAPVAGARASAQLPAGLCLAPPPAARYIHRLTWRRPMLRNLVIAAALVAAPAFAGAAEWNVDPAHSVASFTVKHMMVSTVRGELGKMSGTASWSKP